MADFTGKWRPVETDGESFVKYFEAMEQLFEEKVVDYKSLPDGRAMLAKFQTSQNHEVIDKGDVIILRYADPTALGGQKDNEFKVGQECVGVGPIGIPVKKFLTREGNKLTFEETGPNGQKSTTIREIQGDRMLFSKRHDATGVTASCVYMRENSDV